MCRTRFTLEDIGGELSERALLSFVRRLPAESETVRELVPDGGWSRTDMLLARICEGIEMLSWITMCRGLKRSKWPQRPEPIARPGVKSETKRVGHGPIPISDFDKWYYGGE